MRRIAKIVLLLAPLTLVLPVAHAQNAYTLNCVAADSSQLTFPISALYIDTSYSSGSDSIFLFTVQTDGSNYVHILNTGELNPYTCTTQPSDPLSFTFSSATISNLTFSGSAAGQATTITFAFESFSPTSDAKAALSRVTHPATAAQKQTAIQQLLLRIATQSIPNLLTAPAAKK
jgi:hypothetical protein